MRRLVVTAIILALTVLAGCGRKYHLQRDDIGSEAVWAAPHDSPRNAGSAETSDFNGHLNLLWREKIGGKPAGPLALYNGALVLPETKKKIRFYDALTGHGLGRIKTKTPAQSGVVISDTLGFFAEGPRRNALRGMDLLRHRTLWKLLVKDVNSGPIIVNNRLIVSSGDGRVSAYSLDEGELLWQVKMDGRLEASASFDGDRLWQADDRGALAVLSPEDGSELFRVTLDGPVVSPVAIADRVYATTMTGRVYALDKSDGTVIWERDLGAPIWTTPAVAHGRLYIGHSGGAVVALDADDGSEVWSYGTKSVVRASPVVVGRYVLTGTMDGRVIALDTDQGTLEDATEVDGAVRFSPVTDGRRLYVATQSGRIYCFGENDEPSDRADNRIDPQSEP